MNKAVLLGFTAMLATGVAVGVSGVGLKKGYATEKAGIEERTRTYEAERDRAAAEQEKRRAPASSSYP